MKRRLFGTALALAVALSVLAAPAGAAGGGKTAQDTLAVGYYCTAVVKEDGSLWMWGDNTFDQLGNGTKVGSTVPIKLMDGVASVSAGGGFQAAVKTDGTLWTWGSGGFGELGNGFVRTSATKPLKIMEDVAAAGIHSQCAAAIKTDGSLWLWGENTDGYLGFPDSSESVKTTGYADGVFREVIARCQPIPVRLSGFSVGAATEQPGLRGVSDWARDGVAAACESGLVPALTGNPGYQDAITREQFAELAAQTAAVICGSPDAPSANPFTDTANPAVLRAFQAGIVSGVGGGRFAPTQTTDREQIAAMIARVTAYVKEKTGVDLTPTPADLSRFSDKGAVSAWAAEGMGLLAANGIMNGTTATTLFPQSSCTVEQSILLLQRVYEAYQNQNAA